LTEWLPISYKELLMLLINLLPSDDTTYTGENHLKQH